SRERSSVGRASASLICTWTTAAPAAWHSFAVVTSSSRVTGSAGTADFSDSAPVGATVIKVAAADGLLLMIRACLLSPARVHPGAAASCRRARLACGRGGGEGAAGGRGRPRQGGRSRPPRAWAGGGVLPPPHTP